MALAKRKNVRHMEELIGFILELLFEVFLELLAAAIDDLVNRSAGEALNFPEISNPTLAAIGYLILGAFSGGISVVLFPHPFFPRTRYHGISMVISPWLTGAFLAIIGRYFRGRGREATRIESFAYGFVFAFGMAAIRFLFTS